MVTRKQTRETARHRYIFLRDFRAGDHLEAFFISAVAAILGIRVFLRLTGYIQLGTETLHIAHMLWGGLLMAAGVIILLTFLTRGSQNLAAVIAGVGFGTFIDELGKFITQDNDYFFQPTVALIYAVLVLTFIAARTVRTRRPYTPTEYLLNGLREVESVALHDLDPEEQQRALRWFERSAQDNPVVRPMQDLLRRSRLVPPPQPTPFTKLRLGMRRLYRRLVAWPWFNTAIVIFFIVEQTAHILTPITVLLFGQDAIEQLLRGRPLPGIARGFSASPIELGELASSLLSGILVVLGVLRIRRSRLAAYRMFQRSVLVSLFLTQFFAFFRQEFLALAGLAFYILVLLTLRYMIDREQSAANGLNA